MKRKSYAEFRSLPDNDRRGLIEESAQQRKIIPSNIEKDYWVCRVLGTVMKTRPYQPKRIFKGGTSLSKGFDLINRFSEDIDIALSHRGLMPGKGDEISPRNTHLSEVQKKELFIELRKRARRYVHGRLMENLKGQLGNCKIEIDPSNSTGLTLFVNYPTLFPSSDPLYNPQRVKIEITVKSAQQPTQDKYIKPYVQDVLPREWNLGIRGVTMLKPERTFLEKVMAIHSRNCRFIDDGKKPSDPHGLTRHDYDIATMSTKAVGRRAMKDLALLEEVRLQDRFAFSRHQWRAIDEAVPGSIRVVPPKGIETHLESDYKNVRQMMYGDDPPSFDWVIDRLKNIHDVINEPIPKL